MALSVSGLEDMHEHKQGGGREGCLNASMSSLESVTLKSCIFYQYVLPCVARTCAVRPVLSGVIRANRFARFARIG